jgi:hypothetical protein
MRGARTSGDVHRAREAMDIADFEEDHEAQNKADARPRYETI